MGDKDPMSEPLSATVTALLFTLSRSPILVSEKVQALEEAAEILRTLEMAELELLWETS